MSIRFALAVYYLENMGCKYGYFCYIGEDCLDVSVKKMNEILTNFETFLRKKMLAMTNDEKMKHHAAAVCYLWTEKFNREDKNFVKVKDHSHYTGHIQFLFI